MPERSLMVATDTSFVDNTPDRKNYRGSLISLFWGPIDWNANKQDIVTTSSTEAELLSSRGQQIRLHTTPAGCPRRASHPVRQQADDSPVDEDSVELNTKLNHIDFHNYWLR